MSQNRIVKRVLSIQDNVATLNDRELRDALKSYNQTPGPITDSTRVIYRRKLVSLMEQTESERKAVIASSTSQTKKLIDEPVEEDDEDTSDEDYDEESTESDEEETDEEMDDEESVEDSLDDEVLRDDVNLSSTTVEEHNDNNITSLSLGPEAYPNRVSRFILTLVGSFFVLIFSLYYASIGTNNKFLSTSLPWKDIVTRLMAVAVFWPIAWAAYRGLKIYRQRCQREIQVTCDLVNQAIELLQSPDNPTAMMPILHIRDTLLTPAERKNKKGINMWNKAVKFVEENESRVKVEMVNIDGEDFRAWKWIGARKI